MKFLEILLSHLVSPKEDECILERMHYGSEASCEFVNKSIMVQSLSLSHFRSTNETKH